MTTLDAIRNEIAHDPSNAWTVALGYKPVYAAAPQARVVIVGQAPGRRAQESGVPWDDPSGVRLREWLGVSDEQFYDASSIALLPMDFFYPSKGAHGDLPPRKDFAPHWHPRILAELRDVRLTVLVGLHAQRYYLRLPTAASLTATVQSYEAYLPAMIPIVHPSPLNFRWLRRNPWFEADVVPVLQHLVRQALS